MNDSSTPHFENDIKPLFRESDRDAMLDYFDLWSFIDVTSNVGRIFDAISEGWVPCARGWCRDAPRMQHLWSRAVATQRQPLANAYPHAAWILVSSAVACIHSRRMLHGKEGLDGSSPSEGFEFRLRCLC
jgi:hypothetical protein